MTITALSLALTLLAADPTSTAARPMPTPAQTPSLKAAAAVGEGLAGSAQPRWMTDATQKRPAALPMLYASFGVLQMADAYSTRRALNAGAVESNPLMKGAARSNGTMYAVKAASAVASIYLAEKAWKKNRKGTVILMAVVNGVTAAIVAKNLRNAR